MEEVPLAAKYAADDMLRAQRAADVETQRRRAEALRRRWSVGVRELVLIGLVALVIGVVGAAGARLYFQHNDQHARAEQFQREQRELNGQLIQAINQLGAPKK